MLLLKLAKFITARERSTVIKLLHSKTEVDPWNPQGAILCDKIDILKALRIPGIVKVIDLKEPEIITENLSEFIEHLLKYTNKKTALDITLWKGIPFNKKAIYDRLSKKKVDLVSDPQDAKVYLYIEARPKDNKVVGRIGEIHTVVSRDQLPKKKISIILDNPLTKHEIADFLRLGTIFKIPIKIIAQNSTTTRALKNAKEIIRTFKSNEVQIEVYEDIKSAIGNSTPIAFTMWPTYQKESLERVISKNKSFSFIFGNEVNGISFDTRLLVKRQYVLGPRSSECMRAAQAAAYLLGKLSRL